MNPNDVHELQKSIIQEHALPITAYNGKILLIVEGEYPEGNASERYAELKQCLETIIRQWKGDRILEKYKDRMFDGTWYATVIESFSQAHNQIERVASDSSHVSEARKVLKSLIEEQALPINIIEHCKVVILPDKPIEYRTEEMIELDDLLQKMELEGSLEEDIENIYVRHSGFSLHPQKGIPDIDFSKFQELANYLQSEIVEHGLYAKLLHEGFVLESDNKLDIHRAESEELAYRLTVMTGLDFRVSGFRTGGIKVRTTYLRADRAYPY